MTTIIAIKAKDGLIMASDLQRTGTVIERATKIRRIRPHELLGCAGTPNYIDVFYNHVRDSLATAITEEGQVSDYLSALNSAVDSYGKYIVERIDNLKLERLPTFNITDCYPEGLFAVYEAFQQPELNRYRIFEIITPYPCLEVELRYRATAGSEGR